MRRAVLALAVAAACHRAPPRQMLLIAGSSTMQRYMTHIVTAFQKAEPRIMIVNEAGGASAGIIALKRGAIDLATLTRDLKKDEDDAQLRDYLVARDGLAIIVNPTNPVANLTLQQVRSIYEGKVTSWKDVGGKDEKIDILIRDPAAQIQHSFRDLVLQGNEMPPGRLVAGRKELIAAIQLSPGALGFVSLRGLVPEVKALTINGVPMNRLTILSGRYPLCRSFYLVLYGMSTPAAEKLTNFALSDAGQAIVADDGLIPVH